MKEYENWNFFLWKVSGFFIVYFLIGFLSILLIKYDLWRSKLLYRYLLLERNLIVLIIISLSIKLLMGFISKFVFTGISILFFIIDCLLHPLICLGLWFYFDEKNRLYSESQGFWVIVYGFSTLTISIAFFLTTFFFNERLKYNYQFAIPIMIVFNLIATKLID